MSIMLEIGRGNMFNVKMKNSDMIHLCGDSIEAVLASDLGNDIGENRVDYIFQVAFDAMSGIVPREQVEYIINTDNIPAADVPKDTLYKPLELEDYTVIIKLLSGEEVIVTDCAYYYLDNIIQTPMTFDYVFTNTADDIIARIPRENVLYIARIDTLNVEPKRIEETK